MAEKIIEVIPNLLKTKFLSQTAYNMCISNENIIFANLTSKMISDAAKANAENQKGFFKKMAASMGSGINYYKKYYDMDAKDVLAEDQKNFSISINSVNKIRFIEGMMYEDGHQTSSEIIIKGSFGKHKFKLGTGALHTGEIKKRLKNTALAGKL